MVYLHDRKPCFLADPEWKTVPFAGDCPPKTVMDLLIDILLELPGVLHAVEVLREGDLSRRILLHNGLKLAYWVRRLIQDLERWKVLHMWRHPAFAEKPTVRNMKLLELCELATGQNPYQSILGEVLNGYCAAHLLLARIASAMADKSVVFGTLVRPPYMIRDLIEAIVLVSKKHLVTDTVEMISMMITAFPLKVAAHSVAELDDTTLTQTIQGLLDQLNGSFARRFNISYSVMHD
nr:hypothetical protein CFP56_21369 [Quercus suber]